MKYKIAIIGATGIVGRTLLKILQEKGLLDHKYSLYASSKSAGKLIVLGKKHIKIKLLDDNILKENFDFAIFCTREEVSKKYVKRLAKSGTKVIDFSSSYRKNFPLIVPEINANKIKGNVICNPNCSTIAGVMALYEVHKKFGLKRIIYSTYQAVSGAGKNALDDLKSGVPLKCFAYPIKNNLIPYIGTLGKNLYSKEENKMIYETKKILDDKSIQVDATCVRVPIDICHSESITFETKKRSGLNKIRDVLKHTQGVVYEDEFPLFPMPINVRGGDEVHVGRLRKDLDVPNAFHIFVVSDNLRKGAAQNGAQILEKLIERKKQ